MKITNLLSSASINDIQISRGEQDFAQRGAPNSSGEGTQIVSDLTSKIDDDVKTTSLTVSQGTSAPIMVVAADKKMIEGILPSNQSAPNMVEAAQKDIEDRKSSSESAPNMVEAAQKITESAPILVEAAKASLNNDLNINSQCEFDVCDPIDITSKMYAAQKYQRRSKKNKDQKSRKISNVQQEYSDLVEDIRRLRTRNQPKLLHKRLKQLDAIKKERKQLRAYAQTSSSSEPSLIKKYGTPLLDALYSIIEAAKAARDYVGEEVLKFLLDLFTTLYNVYTKPDWQSILLNASSFFLRNFDKRYSDMALTWFKQAFNIAFAQDDKMSYSEYILSFFDLSDSILNDRIWHNVSDFFAKIITLYAAGKNLVSIETLDLNTICEKFHIFQQSIPQTSDIIELAFEAYKFVAGQWENICTGNWSKLLLGKDETKIFELEVRELEQAYNFVLSGQEIELKNVYKITPDEYELRLKKAVEEAKNLIIRTTSVQQRMSVSNFVKKLTDMQSNLWARKADAPTKEEAYAIKMSGPSSCGKSTMIKIISKTILNAYGRDANEGGSVVFTNLDENYESTILPSHRIIVADDVGNNLNSKPNFDRLLNYVNTVPRPLEKAAAEEKGKYYPGNDALIATTNDETIRAIDCSVCPESILRRFALDIGVEIREQFQNDFGGLKKQETLRFDVYKLTLKRFQYIDIDEDGNQEVIWDIIPRSEWNPFTDEEHDFHALCSFIAEDVKRHRRQQKSQSVIQKQIDTCGFCEDCGCPEIICACTEDLVTDDSQSNDESTVSSEISDPDAITFVEGTTEEEIQNIYSQTLELKTEDVESSISSNTTPIISNVKQVPTMIATTQAFSATSFQTYWQSMSTRELWDMKACLTNVGFCLRNFSKTSMVWYKLYQDRRTYGKLLGLIILSSLLSTIIGAPITQTISVASMSGIMYLYNRTIKMIDQELNNRQDRLSSLCDDISTHLENNARKYFAISGGIFLAYGFYKAIKPFLKYTTQDKSTYLEPLVDHFARVLDAPAKGEYKFEIQDERDYKEGYSRLPPKDTAISKTTTSSDLQQSLARSLRVVVVKSRGEVYGTVNGIMVASNVIMVPAHVIPYTFPFDIETTTSPGVPSAKTKDQKLTEEYCHIDREHDHAFIHLSSSPAGTDYSHFFPEEYPTFYNRSTVMLWKSPENEVKISRQAARPNHDVVRYAGYLEHPGWLWGQKHKLTILDIAKGEGLSYSTEFRGFGGLCGALLIDASLGIIYGFHVAGVPNTSTGWSTGVLQSHIKTALAKLKQTSPNLVVHSLNEVVVDAYDQPYEIVNEKPHYMREDGTKEQTVVSYLGTVLKDGLPLENRARTPYVPTPFEGIAENLGECKHRPPSKPNAIEKSMKVLNKLTDPVQHYEADILRLAIADYQEHTLSAITADPDAKEILRVYTQEEAMDGIGKFGLNGIPSNTSSGFPIHKSKKHCLVRDVQDNSLIQVPREFNDNFDIQSEIDRTIDNWSNGLRSEAIYKASSKVNELLPIAKAKDKVRKFYASPFANFVASRRALAGIPQIMKKHWKVTECLVGLNPVSKEWGEFHDYLVAYGCRNMIAGDFSGFDTRMAAQITSAAAKIMISWYEAVGCSQEDITLIEGALSDIVHPNILFDGNLYRFANGNPSGNLITVQLNSICNSIMMRYVYYAQMPKIREKFAQNVRLGTYGDDNAMSVKKHCSWYTHTSCQAEFEKLDIGYTMADKDAESRPYIGIEEISFLKRHFVKHEELNCIVGPIEEDSILKRFHWIKKPGESPLSATEQFGAYTDGAIRDKYLYGREAYDEFLSKLRNIVSMNPSLRGVINFIPYDEMTQILKSDYAHDYVNRNLKLFVESYGTTLDDLAIVD